MLVIIYLKMSDLFSDAFYTLLIIALGKYYNSVLFFFFNVTVFFSLSRKRIIKIRIKAIDTNITKRNV